MVKCNRCLKKVKLIEWTPLESMDPRLRHYICQCGHTFYEAPRSTKRVQGIMI